MCHFRLLYLTRLVYLTHVFFLNSVRKSKIIVLLLIVYKYIFLLLFSYLGHSFVGPCVSFFFDIPRIVGAYHYPPSKLSPCPQGENLGNVSRFLHLIEVFPGSFNFCKNNGPMLWVSLSKNNAHMFTGLPLLTVCRFVYGPEHSSYRDHG